MGKRHDHLATHPQFPARKAMDVGASFAVAVRALNDALDSIRDDA